MLEDDQQLGSVIKQSLELKKYQVDWLTGSEMAPELYSNGGYDICLVDIGLPGMSGTDFVKEIRQSDLTTPILFMSGSHDDKDMIHAYCAGGDDFIAKPFSTTELALRIYALLRRSAPAKNNPGQPDLMAFGNFTFDYPNRLLCSSAGEVSLTKKEAEVLRMLARNLNNVVKREAVLYQCLGRERLFHGTLDGCLYCPASKEVAGRSAGRHCEHSPHGFQARGEA